MILAKLREPPHRSTVFLVRPGELEPELALRDHGRGMAARQKQAQHFVALRALLVHALLQRPEFLQSAARQDPEALSGSAQGAHVRSTSNSAVVRSSSAITAQ